MKKVKRVKDKIELTSFNVDKIGLAANNLKDRLNNEIAEYKSYFIIKLNGKKLKYPISMKSIQSTQGKANRNRRVLGLRPLSLFQDLVEWKRHLIIRDKIKSEKALRILGVPKVENTF